MRWVAAAASVAGPRHLDRGEPNQDAMALSGWRGGWIAALADGVGSRASSAIGSRQACRVARRILRAAADPLDVVTTLEGIHGAWRNAIAPVAPRDAATTLVFSRVSRGGEVVAGQLGDGLLLLRCDGVFRRITPERAGFGNQTQALEEVHRPEHWVVARGMLSGPGDGVLMMSDGVADDLEPDQLDAFMDALYQDLRRRNRRTGRRWMESELNHWPTPLHSDDKTLAAIFRSTT